MILLVTSSFYIDYKFRKSVITDFKENEKSYKTVENGIKVVRLKEGKNSVKKNKRTTSK